MNLYFQLMLEQFLFYILTEARLFSDFILCVNVGLFLSLSHSHLYQKLTFKKDKSSKVTKLFIVGLLSDICVRLLPKVCSSPFLYQLVTPPLTTRHFPTLSIYWWFSGHTKPSPFRHFWLYWCLNQALSPLKQTKQE